MTRFHFLRVHLSFDVDPFSIEMGDDSRIYRNTRANSASYHLLTEMSISQGAVAVPVGWEDNRGSGHASQTRFHLWCCRR